MQSQDSFDLKEVILTEIVNNNIWTDEDLSALFERIQEEYQSLPPEKVTQAIEFVKSAVIDT